MKQLPKPLQKGDTVAIVATARKVSQEEIAPSVKIIEGWGLKVIFSPHLFRSENQFAGSDSERCSDLQWALDHKDVKAIVMARGGYGTLRIVDNVNFERFVKNPKWVVGYSDITVLSSHLINLGVASIHGTMAFSFSQDAESTESVRKLLFGEDLNYEMESHPLNKCGEGKAELVGGNLSVLYALSGSESDIVTKNKILFIEDLDEYLYHVDRMILQMKRSGKLKDLKGLIVGGMTEMKDNKIPFGKTAEEIIFDAVKEYNYPVCFNFPAGHIKRNLAFCIGKMIQLVVYDSGTKVDYIED